MVRFADFPLDNDAKQFIMSGETLMISYIGFVAGLFGAIMAGSEKPVYCMIMCIMCAINLFHIFNF